MKQNRAPHTSCSQCLTDFLEFESNLKDQDWEALGMQKPHCLSCIEALKNRHSAQEKKREYLLPIRRT